MEKILLSGLSVEEFRQIIAQELEAHRQKMSELFSENELPVAQLPVAQKKGIEIDGSIYLDSHEAADLIGSTYNTIKARGKVWGLKKYKVGRHVYYKESELKQWLENKLMPI